MAAFLPRRRWTFIWNHAKVVRQSDVREGEHEILLCAYGRDYRTHSPEGF